jgi:hypothetical protein
MRLDPQTKEVAMIFLSATDVVAIQKSVINDSELQGQAKENLQDKTMTDKIIRIGGASGFGDLFCLDLV